LKLVVATVAAADTAVVVAVAVDFTQLPAAADSIQLPAVVTMAAADSIQLPAVVIMAAADFILAPVATTAVADSTQLLDIQDKVGLITADSTTDTAGILAQAWDTFTMTQSVSTTVDTTGLIGMLLSGIAQSITGTGQLFTL
jgi:hypothetical protein